MDSEIELDCYPWLRLYKNGRVERLVDESMIPPSLEPQDGVVSKDVVYSPEKNLSVRIYLHQKPVETAGKKKLPLLIYFHGGGFILETAFCSTYHTFLTSVISEGADCIAVSVDYRRAPEHPIPIAYEDSWDALEWVFSHIAESGPEVWLNKHADFSNVFLAGDSAGGNIAHHMGIKAGKEKLDSRNFEISGIVLIHPYFWSKTPIDEEETEDVKVRKLFDKLWEIASPSSKNGAEDPWINVVGSDSSDISGLGCKRVLVMLAGKDELVRQGWGYAEKLERSGWEGKMEVVEIKDELHVFHLRNPNSNNARRLLKKFADFLRENAT